MAENIHINQEKVQEDAGNLEAVSACLKAAPLEKQDSRTTLPANENSRMSYERSQKNIADLGAALTKEADNIRKLGIAFEEFDEMAGSLAERGNGQ